MPAKRYKQHDWLELGLATLKESGPTALTVDELCHRAEKTRGSFYFHFEHVDAFLTQLADRWYSDYTDDLVGNSTPNSDRTDLLNLLAARLDLKLESGIRQLAQVNPSVMAIVQRAENKRMSWLTELYQRSGRYSESDAKHLAQIELAAFVGFRLIEPDLDARRSRELYEAFLRFTDRA